MRRITRRRAFVGGELNQACSYVASRRVALVALALAVFANTPLRLFAQPAGAILGKVTAENGAALSGASVEVQGTKVRTLTDDQGAFRVTGIPPGQASLQVKRLGFRPDSVSVQVPTDGFAELNIRLPVAAEDLTPVTVRARKLNYTGRLAGYYERLERRNSGVFITRQQIDEERPRTLSQLLQPLAGVTIVRLRAGSTGIRLRDRTCAPLIWLDGNPLPAGEIDLDSFHPTSLQGIELYLGSTSAPLKYMLGRDMSNCGTILLWSRSGDTDFPDNVPTTAAHLEDLVASHVVFTADQVDEPARLLSGLSLDAAYPPALNAAHMDGLVIAEFVVDTSGNIEEETFGVVSSSHPLFSEAVRTALKEAVFKPARIKGVAVRQLVHQPFEFKGGN